MDDNVDKWINVDEKTFTNFTINGVGYCSYCVKSFAKLIQITQFAALEFQMYCGNNKLQIKDIGGFSKLDVPLAQIICWEWNKEGAQVIKETKILYMGSIVEFNSFSSSSSVVIRILLKREKSDENPCPPLSSPDDDLTVQIGGKKVTVSAAWLMSVSPVVQRMFSVEMKEKQQRQIILDELGVDMELFMAFLENISPNVLHKPILPNPKNVLVLLKLSDFFQVDSLKLRCELHLTNCVEIPLVDRFLLIDKYGLNNLKNFFLRLDVEKLRAFFKANREQLLPVVSNDFLGQFTFTLAG